MKKIKIALIIILSTLINMKAVLADSDSARNFVNNIASEVIKTVDDHHISDSDKEKKLIDLFKNSIDINWIGKFALGKYSKTISDTQRQNYNKAFENLLIDTYIPNFKKYTNEKFEITNVISSGKGEYLVQTEILKGSKQNNIKVDYALKSNDSGVLKIFDIVAEGVSLINTKRNEFSSILSQHNIDYLVDQLSKKLVNK